MVPEIAKGNFASAPLEDILSRKNRHPNFAVGILEIKPAVSLSIIHPEKQYQLSYRPSTDIATPFFFVGNRPLQQTGHTLETIWPQGIVSLFAMIDGLEKFLAKLTRSEEFPYLPLLPAWRVYRSLG
jgi:hypothetical protein